MDTSTIKEALLWSAIINYGVLLWWFLIFAFARNWLHRFHGRWFQMSADQFSAIHYAGMAMYKVGILLLNLVPYLALLVVA